MVLPAMAFVAAPMARQCLATGSSAMLQAAWQGLNSSSFYSCSTNHPSKPHMPAEGGEAGVSNHSQQRSSAASYLSAASSMSDSPLDRNTGSTIAPSTSTASSILAVPTVSGQVSSSSTESHISSSRSITKDSTHSASSSSASSNASTPPNHNGWAAASSSQARLMSTQPEHTVYSGPSAPPAKRVTMRTLRAKYMAGEPICMITAYDYPSAVHVDESGADVLLVGDSVAMVVHGYDTTLPITLEEMLMHCRAVSRGAKRALLVGDLPFGCYETSAVDAVRSAVRMLKDGGMDAVKLEGGSPGRVEAARAIVEAGVAVMGHVGLTPQSISVIGGFRPQAQAAEEAMRVLQQALELQKAGCFAVVLECIPGPIAAAITHALSIPTIGIGAGIACSGQVLVYHDLLGMLSHPHHAKVTPKFCKQYARVGDAISTAIQQYRREVVDRTFPSQQYSPYKISVEEVTALQEQLTGAGLPEVASALKVAADLETAARQQLAADRGKGNAA